ncbi:Piso0_003318 [Millerozyma farinosa CBS 7064]|uniref:Piso0_003318 protein n=1 Tax=Pichia sorbitophila (strain ATCC MYA-4447 / BCRC 22081 / CBS 7064 / NBRC 10061 / NRRL Y-12695) TaxID=559304 RepID=G8YHS9_PICSO|nr:Piso0_003318 [Millerozyma farinosa CBS 7064]CCE80981.1 Piso0_003318 [Millerozyma farinosa CBS 7064]
MGGRIGQWSSKTGKRNGWRSEMEKQRKRSAQKDLTLGPLCSLAARRENLRLNGARLLSACELLYFPSPVRASSVVGFRPSYSQSRQVSDWCRSIISSRHVLHFSITW